jgi:hypothetical protein
MSEDLFPPEENQPDDLLLDSKSTSSSSKTCKTFRVEWVKLPLRWVEALRQSKNASTCHLAMALLFEAFKRKHVGGEVVLSSAMTGMPRNTRMRAAKELTQLGLIQLHRQDGSRSYRVSIIY